jgi:hypothetical protein
VQGISPEVVVLQLAVGRLHKGGAAKPQARVAACSGGSQTNPGAALCAGAPADNMYMAMCTVNSIRRQSQWQSVVLFAEEAFLQLTTQLWHVQNLCVTVPYHTSCAPSLSTLSFFSFGLSKLSQGTPLLQIVRCFWLFCRRYRLLLGSSWKWSIRTAALLAVPPAATTMSAFCPRSIGSC